MSHIHREGFLQKYDLFIFDWDGTLVNIKIINKLNETINLLWLKKKAASRKRALANLRVKLKAREEREARESEEYKSIADVLMLLFAPKLQDGSLDVLRLIEEGKREAVLFSNGAYWRVSKEARVLGVRHYFKALVSAQELGYLKPNPAGINAIIRKFGASRARTLYIGDMIDDVLCARLAKIDCCALASGFDSYEALEAERPKYLLKDMREFLDRLK